eukprot:CAMPEP_0202348780 /NCGR_PEP_ID=MMETSP1126-20121109/6553_1 /ASSEMBLY_ACC=CAM_ASM_000457 /TAXON_ID=3047 /ORGANISM="Dunaliella tertiolecta, Strain CCMP1320" /LENGTH=130 /DNA_ID=CAMNT_0048940495 /DNA_START=780 /DNA_END=1172 /DNA_ORIENTATION=+
MSILVTLVDVRGLHVIVTSIRGANAERVGPHSVTAIDLKPVLCEHEDALVPEPCDESSVPISNTGGNRDHGDGKEAGHQKEEGVVAIGAVHGPVKFTLGRKAAKRATALERAIRIKSTMMGPVVGSGIGA